jgi:hypothetical protein
VLGVSEDREGRRQQIRFEQFAVASHRPDTYLVSFLADVAQLIVQTVDVDQGVEVGQTKFHHWQKTVAARDDARAVTAFVQ